MFGSVFAKATGFLDTRFVLNVLLPSLAFWGGIVLLAARGSHRDEAVAAWSKWSGLEQTLVVGAAIAALMLFAFVAGGQITTWTRLWEGYWPAPLSAAARWGRRRERNRWDALDLATADGYTRRFYRYPVAKDDVLPTRLGNVLRAAEDYPGDEERYGLDAVFFWPRLYLVLPADARKEVDDARSAMDRMILLATLAVAFPVAALATVAWAGTSWPAWLTGAVAAAVVTVAAYRAAVSAAVTFGDLVRSCFDLHRRTLLTALGLPSPPTLDEERALWMAVQQQLYRRAADRPELLRFTAPPDVGAAPARPTGNGN